MALDVICEFGHSKLKYLVVWIFKKYLNARYYITTLMGIRIVLAYYKCSPLTPEEIYAPCLKKEKVFESKE